MGMNIHGIYVPTYPLATVAAYRVEMGKIEERIREAKRVGDAAALEEACAEHDARYNEAIEIGLSYDVYDLGAYYGDEGDDDPQAGCPPGWSPPTEEDYVDPNDTPS